VTKSANNPLSGAKLRGREAGLRRAGLPLR